MAKPQIGYSMLYCLDEPFKSLLKRLRKVDVKHVELADEGLHTLNKRRAKKLNEIAQSCNLDFVVHAPWAGVNIATPSPALRRAVLKRLEQSIIIAGQLNCRLWLFHPGSRTGLSQFYPGKDWQLNLESVHTLLKLARREGVPIAIENTPEPFPSLMKSVGDFHNFYKDLNEDIGMVLDVAHANLNNQIQDFLKQFSEKIVHMHVSDNNGQSDLHLGIGYGNIDWENVAKAVNKADYGKLIMIESTDHVQESLQFLRELFV
ncbi:MAG: sugar phosphate isomerase/epimerase [Candidatus Bathyarchaeota archaeon]|nr:sugar phosphate isomerase/epimerase [Candidatus Bathyarchaeum sp.]